jgi:hypothetical protein
MSLKACAGGLALLLVALGCDKLRTLPGFELAPIVPPPPAAVVATGPWLLDPLPGQVTVAWTTREPAAGRVWFGTREPDHLASEEGQPVKEHRVVLRPLEPSTQYRYRVEGGNETAWFTSAPKPGAEGPIQVLVYGVNRSNNGDHALVARAAAAERSQLALHTGDMVVNAAEEPLWQVWFQEEHDLLLHAPLLVTAGKHDVTDYGAAYARFFQRNRRPRYGSLDYGPVHVVTLDSFETPGGISPAQKAWFEEDLRGVPAERHVWVLAHQGPFAHPAESGPEDGGVAEAKAAILSAHRVHPIEAVFSGQRPFYERGELDGIRYFVLGGGGAPLEEPDPSASGVQSAARSLSYATVQVCGCHSAGRVKDIAGRVLDAFTLADCATPCGVPGWAASVAAASVISVSEGPGTEDSRRSKRRSRKRRHGNSGRAPTSTEDQGR